MLPTLCAILAAPQQHSSILLDGCLELATLALAPSPPDAARSIHAAATPAVLQVGGGALPTRNSLRSCCVWKLGGPPSLVPRSALCRSLRGQGHRCIAYTSLFHLLPRSPTRVPPPPPPVRPFLQLILHHDDAEVLRSATAYLRTLLQVGGGCWGGRGGGRGALPCSGMRPRKQAGAALWGV
jgi:hypothetical protein